MCGGASASTQPSTTDGARLGVVAPSGTPTLMVGAQLRYVAPRGQFGRVRGDHRGRGPEEHVSGAAVSASPANRPVPIPASEIRMLRSVSLLVGLALAGALLLALHPAGEGLRGRVLPPQQILNGLLLAGAGPVALIYAYWPVLWRAVEPYGLSTYRRIGGLWLLVIIALSTLAPAALLARDERVAGLASCGGITLAWALLIEGQRRRRRELARDAWTDPTIDALRVHLEFLALGAASLIAAVGVALTAEGVLLSDLIAIALWITSAGLYAGVLAASGRGLRPAQALAVAYGIGSFLLYDHPSPALRFAIGLGAVMLAGLLEFARRRAVAARLRELVEIGLSGEIGTRYPELAAQVPALSAAEPSAGAR